MLITVLMILLANALIWHQFPGLDDFQLELSSDSIGNSFEDNSINFYNLYPGEYKISFNYRNISSCPAKYLLVADMEDHKILAQENIQDSMTHSNLSFSVDERYENISITTDEETEITSLAMRSEKSVYRNRLLCFLISSMIILLIAWAMYKREKNILILSFICLLICAPLFSKGLYEGQDISFHLTRIIGLASDISVDQIPARLNPAFNDGMGYINSIMYPELFLYIPALFCYAGMDLWLSMKLLYCVITVLTAVITYVSAKTVCSEKSALFFSIVYLLSPYRLNEIYIRCAVGEALAMAFLPAVIAGMWSLLNGDTKKGIEFALTGYTGVLQSHTISFYFICVFTVFWLVIHLIRIRFHISKEKTFGFVKFVLLFLMINLWLIVPFIACYQYGFNASMNSRDVSFMALNPFLLFKPGYHYADAPMNGAVSNAMSLSIGIQTLIIVAVYLFSIFKDHNKNEGQRFYNVMLINGFIALFASTDLFPWHLIHISRFQSFVDVIQFPWRLLTIACVSFSFLIASYSSKQKYHEVTVLILAATLISGIVQIHGYTTNTYFAQSKDTLHLADNMNEDLYLFNGDEFSENSEDGLYHYVKEGVTSEAFHISEYEKNGLNLSFNAERISSAIDAENNIHLPLYGYEIFYSAFSDFAPCELKKDENNMLEIALPEYFNSGSIHVVYHEPRLFQACTWVSGLTIILLLIYKIFFVNNDRVS